MQTILIGGDLDHGKPHASRLGFNALHVFDLGRGHAFGGLRSLRAQRNGRGGAAR